METVFPAVEIGLQLVIEDFIAAKRLFNSSDPKPAGLSGWSESL